MAFNPFRAFRKHQKVFFAGLTILCMITFVLTGSISASWDFFQGFATIFGGRGSSPDVAKLYGKRVFQNELAQLQKQRAIANKFMGSAMQMASFSAMNSALDAIQKSQMDRQLQSQIQRDAQMFLQGLDPQFSKIFGIFSQQIFMELDSIRTQVAIKKPEDAVLILQLQEALSQLARLQRSVGEFYFGGGMEGKSLLDFMIWKHQADHLGIQLTDDDVNAVFFSGVS